jgi:hypothetical protein
MALLAGGAQPWANLPALLKLVCVAASIPTSAAAPFSPGNIAVLRAADSSSDGASCAAFIDEYTPQGSLVQSLAFPTLPLPGSKAFSLSASDPYAGIVTLTEDENALLVVGYAAPPGTASVETTLSASVNRVVAIVSAHGDINTKGITLADFGGDGTNPGYIRCAASEDGVGDFWVTGTSALLGPSVRLVNLSSSAAQGAGFDSSAVVEVGGVDGVT